jgi:hypothetical protein|tara:strand:- start:24558 stop:24752 length:195 start_codon:yes stop_codon:yes gene_type:complete
MKTLWIILSVIVGFFFLSIIIISYLEYIIEKEAYFNFKKNLEKHETKTGALLNDRKNEKRRKNS